MFTGFFFTKNLKLFSSFGFFFASFLAFHLAFFKLCFFALHCIASGCFGYYFDFFSLNNGFGRFVRFAGNKGKSSSQGACENQLLHGFFFKWLY